MQRNFTITTPNSNAKGLFRQTAYHEAGHAVAIFLTTRQRSLPPVFFQINLSTAEAPFDHLQDTAKIEGGRLIENLPPTLEYLQLSDQVAYIKAFEADIINLLAGPLAEANYVARRDNEPINPQLVNLNALSAYGGDMDLQIVKEYIDCFVNDMQQRTEKIDQLFIETYRLVDNFQNWRLISALANHIIHTSKNIISCEEIIDVIEKASAKANPSLQTTKLKRVAY